jgi:Tfp pilus assembly protein PilF
MLGLSYNCLGFLAQDQRDFAVAEKWFSSWKLMSAWVSRLPAATYEQLGMIAVKQGNFAVAEKQYLKSLEINERLGDEHSAAVATTRLDFWLQAG